MMKSAIVLNPGTVVDRQGEKTEWPAHPEDLSIPTWDSGVFINELANLGILPGKIVDLSAKEKAASGQNPENLLGKAQNQAPDQILEGTWDGTQRALNKIYEFIEKRYSSFMDTANFEPAVPSPLTVQEKLQFFSFTDGSDNFPPHLNLAGNKPAAAVEASKDQKSTLQPGDILNKMRLLQLATLLPTLIPKTFIGKAEAAALGLISRGIFGSLGTPDAGTTIADVEAHNKAYRAKSQDIFNLPNVGDVEDWYTDERFAQQHFTGTNPTTIEKASNEWILHFSHASEDSADEPAIKIVASLDPNSLYVQDYSYFRKAAGLDESAIIKCEFDESYKDVDGKTKPRKSFKYGVASVCLFYLTDAGKLLPLAIVLDWRATAAQSVTIYNRELFKRDTTLKTLPKGVVADKEPSKSIDQAHDWAWRYAKTCVQSSDWIRHELTIHLTDTHLVEETIIVGANRTLPSEHIVFRLLYPHWQKTLALNAAARDTLVPQVILPLVGFESGPAFQFIRHAYETFDYTGQYVPVDLRRRGFPPELLDDRKFHNYAYARCIHSMWYKIRSYVAEILSLVYNGPNADTQVKEDKDLQNWSSDIQKAPTDGGGGLKSFPTLNTVEDLIDCVTMAIHIASPQHTAVNYLQNYYQSFVINKPACLYAPPPTSLNELLGYKESDLVAALPMNHPQDWLLASHIPYLLSFKPGDKESLIIYAASKYHVYKYKTSDDDQKTAQAAVKFYKALADSELEFQKYALEADDSDTILYQVLSPAWNAVSILI